VEHPLTYLGFMQGAGAILDWEKLQTLAADHVPEIGVRGETDVVAARLKSPAEGDERLNIAARTRNRDDYSQSIILVFPKSVCANTAPPWRDPSTTGGRRRKAPSL
jgi:hypothetical protein